MKNSPLLSLILACSATLALGACQIVGEDEGGGGGGGAGGGGVPPRNQLVSFEDEVVPILEARACQVCHSKKEDGADEGELTLDAKDNKIYEEIVEEVSPNYGIARVNLDDPRDSLILLLPLGDPNHKVGVFRGTDDPDYQTVLTWIEQGALDN